MSECLCQLGGGCVGWKLLVGMVWTKACGCGGIVEVCGVGGGCGQYG